MLGTARRAWEAGTVPELADPERLAGNLARVYAEMDGAEQGAAIDYAAGWRGMVELNGGLPVCHA